MKYLLLGFVFLGISFQLSAQTYITNDNAPDKAHAAFITARKALFRDDIDTGRKTLEKLLKKYPNYVDALSLKARMHYNLGETEEAEATYLKAIELGAAYQPVNIFGLAVLYYWNDRFDEAAHYMDEYLKYSDRLKPRMVAKATRYKDNSEFASHAIKNPVPFTPRNMGPNINTHWPEYSASLTADGNTLFITRRVEGQEDFYVSRKKDGIWQVARPLGPPINTPDNEGAPSISADGKTIVYTRCNNPQDYGACDLLISEFVNGKWTEPVNMGKPINSRYWESQPSLSADGSILYFISNNPAGKGEKDIWRATKGEDGKWSTPVNVEELNTPNNEVAPFLHTDNQTLYMVSDGYVGMGRRDIYYTRLQEDGKWGTPVNIGYPINDSGEQAGIIVNLEGTKAYYYSEQEGAALDLFEFDMPEAAKPKAVSYFQGNILDEKTKEKLQAHVEVMDLKTGKSIVSLTSRKDGSFIVSLTAGKEYALEVSKKGYSFFSENIQLTDIRDINDPYVKDVELIALNKEVEKGKTFTLNNIFFETASAKLTDKSFPELSKLIDLLQENPSISILIKGHTDNVGDDNANLTLSNDRAASVKQYLIENGINTTRLQTKGYGEANPIDTNETELGRKRNRRTEVEIL